MTKDLQGPVPEMPPARPLCAADLVTYQGAAVVSRTLLKKPTGTVTLFAFARGEGLSEHTAPFDALVHVLEGEVEITIAGELVHAKSGDLVLMPAHLPHALMARTDFKMLLTMVRS
jgi:quercetin dioxygenase-like cupin family protein